LPSFTGRETKRVTPALYKESTDEGEER